MTLAEYRALAGVSQRGLSEAIKVSPAAVAGYECGYFRPSLSVAERVAKFLTARLRERGVLAEPERVRIDDITFKGSVKGYARTRVARCRDGQAA